MTTYDQLADTDDLLVAKEELEELYAWLSQSAPNSADPRGDLHGLDTAITVLSKLIERNTMEVTA